MPTLLAIDGHSLAYRAHHALIRNPLYNSKGENTSAVFGFANSVLHALESYKPDYVAVVFDAKGATWRDKLFKEYKAKRPPMPDELKKQLPVIFELTEALGLTVLQEEGLEADDILAAMARQGKAERFDVLLLTGDKDMFQLIGPNVRVLDTRQTPPSKAGPEAVRERFGLEPSQVADYLALVGDAVDNVPGVKGIGKKGAQSLISKYGSVEGVYDHLDEIGGVTAKKLEEGRKDAELSLRLVKLTREVGLPDLKSLKPGKKDDGLLLELFSRLEFRRLLSLVGAPAPTFRLKETDRPPPGAGLSAQGRAYWWKEGEEAVVTPLSAIRPGDRPVCYDFKALLHQTGPEGPKEPGFDLLSAAWLLSEETRPPSLEQLALTRAGVGLPDKPAEQEALKARLALELRPGVEEELDRTGQRMLYEEVEMPLTGVLARMELRGVRVDLNRLSQLQAELQMKELALLEELYEIAGEEFNPSSPKQLRVILFDRLGLPVKRRTKTGPSTDVRVLTQLSSMHPLPAKILEYREVVKLRSTYIDALPRHISPKDGRIHPEYLAFGAATGRLSCIEPNLMNIPIRTDLGRNIRKAFVADKGNLLVSADYSQIEFRVLAHLTKDRGLIEAFGSGFDFHQATAATVFNVTPEAVTPEQRRKAKMVNYGLLYGMSVFGLADRLNITNDEADTIIKNYFAHFTGLQQWQVETLTKARELGYTETVLGRRRSLPALNSEDRQAREQAERMAINTPVQGSGADIIKKAMVEVEDELLARGWPGGMIMTVHDELVFEVPEERAEETLSLVSERMESCFPMAVELEVEGGAGPDWLAAK